MRRLAYITDSTQDTIFCHLSTDEVMKILATSTDAPQANWVGRTDLLREEAQLIWSLQKSEKIRDIWFTATDHNAVIVLECDSVAEAEGIVSEFPLVRAGLMDFDCVHLVTYDGYERLFSETQTAETVN